MKWTNEFRDEMRQRPHEKAVEIITQSKGTHFDPDMVDAFMESADEFNQIAKHYADM